MLKPICISLLLGLVLLVLLSCSCSATETVNDLDSLETELLVRMAFDAYDVNKDGKASLRELVQYALGEQEAEEPLERLSEAEIRENILEALPEWDRDGNGAISFKELLDVAKAEKI
jgi:Ca2+-binding EF-hand superfamily protein